MVIWAMGLRGHCWSELGSGGEVELIPYAAGPIGVRDGSGAGLESRWVSALDGSRGRLGRVVAGDGSEQQVRLRAYCLLGTRT